MLMMQPLRPLRPRSSQIERRALLRRPFLVAGEVVGPDVDEAANVHASYEVGPAEPLGVPSLHEFVLQRGNREMIEVVAPEGAMSKCELPPEAPTELVFPKLSMPVQSITGLLV